MTIPIFKGVKDEDPESFLRNYKRTCISTGSRTMNNWVTLLSKFLEIRACQYYERQSEGLNCLRII